MPSSPAGKKRGAGTATVLLWALLASAAPPAVDVSNLYEEAIRSFRAGQCGVAVSIFDQVRGLAPGYRETERYSARCAEILKKTDEDRRLSASVRQAREILDARARVLDRLRARAGVVVREDGPRVDLFFPLHALFAGDALEPPSGSLLLSDLKDFVTTFHTPHLIVSWPLSDGENDQETSQGARRAAGLGLRMMQECGLAPERLFIRSRRDPERRVRLAVSTVRPVAEELDGEFRPVILHAPRREVTPGRAPELGLDVILLDPARVRKWVLMLVGGDGQAARRFEGGQDVYKAIAWDGRDERAAPSEPGLYQAFLTAETWSGARRTDSLTFVVKRPPAAAESAPPPAKTKAAEGQDVSKWFHTVTFAPGADDIPGPMFLAVEQAARALRLYPGRRVAVEGFCGPGERGGRRLAQRRAESVRDALIGKHGVAENRILVKGNPPRAPLEGETMNKALIFFLE